jgi:hypothetical protein
MGMREMCYVFSKEFRRDVDEILAILRRLDPHNQAVRIGLALPTITRNGVIVANIELKSDTIETVTITTTDAPGQTVPAPAGDTFTVVSSSPSLTAVIGKDANGNPAVVLTAAVIASPGLSFTVSDSAGLKTITQIVDIVPDLTPSAIGLDITDATTVPNPTPPTAPGP